MKDVLYWAVDIDTKEVSLTPIRAIFRGGFYHIPQNALKIQPVEPKEGFTVIAILDEREMPVDSKLIQDNRDKVIYNQIDCKESRIVTELGAIERGWTLDKPKTQFDDWVEDKWVTNLANQYIYEFNLIDSVRSNLYAQYCDPLMNEARIKRLQGKEIEANALEIQAIAAREKIKTENPWPVNPGA